MLVDVVGGFFCTGCQSYVETPENVAMNPERMALFKDETKRKHRHSGPRKKRKQSVPLPEITPKMDFGAAI